jgi:hypothetical protein
MNLTRFSLIQEQTKLRQGLSHIRDLKHEHVKALLGSGRIKGHVTEKSDGMAFEIGHDEHGIYTRTSRSEKMRNHGDYGKAAKAKFGDAYDPTISGHHDEIHKHLTSNPAVIAHLKKHKGSIKGEVFHKPQGTPVDKHHTRFVGTAYDTRKMGEHGSFIVHSKLPENHHVKSVEHLSNHAFKFDSDHTGHSIDVDAKDLHDRFHAINHDLLHSRKHADREGKELEKRKFESLKNDIHARVSHAIKHLGPKWGPETEGHVIHPHESNPDAPRVKVVDGNFLARKKANEKFVKESVILTEGGNVHFGDQKTVPIPISKRESRRDDVHHFMKSVNKAAGHHLFGKDHKALHTLSAYSGSSRHMMDPSVSTHELGQHKKSFGDVDVQVPHDSEHHLLHALKPGARHGKFTVIGVKKIGAQHSAVVKHDDGDHNQIDFEYKKYEHNEPSKFSQWSQNSHMHDLKHGLKGVMHKHLINAVTSANAKHGIIQTVGKKATKHEEGEVRDHTFSPAHGMRAKHYPVLDNHGNHLHHGDKPVYSEHTTGSVPYDQDLHSIHHKLFGKKATSVGIDAMHSFHGTAGLIKKHLNHEQQKKVVHSFVGKMYNAKDARPVSNDEHDDVKQKDHAIGQLKHHMPEHFTKDFHSQIEAKKKEYVEKNFRKKPISEAEEKKHDVHIAMAAGRFTGPTKEHQKLIDNVLAHPADHHHIFVMGPADHSKTTEKDPLTVHEKIHHLKKLYPNHKHVFVPGTTIHTKTPVAALSWMHFKHKDHAKNMHLHVFAGKGDEGVEKNAGGSIDSYKNAVGRLNKTKFPERTNEQGQKVGGDLRMNYKTTHFHGQERGTTSGSAIRRHAYDHDPENHDHVETFRKMLHSGMTHDHAKEIMHQIKHFKSKHEINESLTAMDHRHRSLSIRPHMIALQRSRKVKRPKFAPQATLQRRANREALRTFRDNLLGLSGHSYNQLSPGQKVWIDSVMSHKKEAIARMSRMLMASGKTRQKEHDRLKRYYGVGGPVKRPSKASRAYNIASEAYDLVAEEAK